MKFGYVLSFAILFLPLMATAQARKAKQSQAQSVPALQFSEESQTPVESIQRLRSLRPVLNDVLYRSGGAGGQVQLSEEAQNSLCEAGFSSGVYLYNTNFKGKASKSCQSKVSGQNSFSYDYKNFRAKQTEILVDIFESIRDKTGPVLVHCWNGWHASGEIAAVALRQFCGWSGDEAAKYWAENIGDKGNLPKYGSIMTRIKKFEPMLGQPGDKLDLRIPPEVQARICPKR